MSSPNNPFPMHVGIVVMDASQLTAVYALLGGASALSVSPSPVQRHVELAKHAELAKAEVQQVANVQGSIIHELLTNKNVDIEDTIDEGAPDVDAHGWPWSADLHASTKGTTKDGLWRMKIGVARPDPKPGFPKSDTAGSTSTASTGETASSPNTAAAIEDAGSADDDEFAAFRAAAAQSDAEEANAKANVPARKWTDADLGALCNQAAMKLGDPTSVKELIAKFTPEGVVAHSRNIPEDQRAEFAAAVEEKAGIEFTG